MFTTIIAFDDMRRTQRKLNRVFYLSTKIQQKDTVLDFVFGSSTGNRITSFRLRLVVPRVLRLLRLDTKFPIELLFQRNSCVADKYGDTAGKEDQDMLH